MIKWIKAFIIGVIIWIILTFIYGFIMGMLNLSELSFFRSNSYIHNFILYPIGIWLGFKITKTSFLGTKNDEKN
jgi:hypothetical protein